MILTRLALQAMSEKQDILDLLQENQEEMDLLAELYKEHKERLDQTKLWSDFERMFSLIHRVYFTTKLAVTS